MGSTQEKLVRFVPAVFVLLWSTGFVVARYATTDAGPMTFLCVRMFVAAGLLRAVTFLIPSSRGSNWKVSSFVGVLMHAVYLGGVFFSISRGLPAGISALIAGLHPVLTSVFGGIFLGERLHRRQWTGVLFGFVGVIIVVCQHFHDQESQVTVIVLVAMAISVIGLVSGTLVQRGLAKKTSLVQGMMVQYMAAGIFLFVPALVFEGFEIRFSHLTILSLLWATFVLSLFSVLLMMYMLSHRSASKVSSLFFLTPALSSIEGAVLFKESMGVIAIIGLAVALLGVWMTTGASNQE